MCKGSFEDLPFFRGRQRRPPNLFAERRAPVRPSLFSSFDPKEETSQLAESVIIKKDRRKQVDCCSTVAATFLYVSNEERGGEGENMSTLGFSPLFLLV